MYGTRTVRPARISALIMVLVLFSTCTSAQRNENPVKVTINENGKQLDLQKGQLLEVVLPVSLGTGFSWRVSTIPDALLRTKGQPEIQKSETDGPKTGGTDLQVFRFEAGDAGTAKLELQYARPWEKDKPPAKTYSLTIKVR